MSVHIASSDELAQLHGRQFLVRHSQAIQQELREIALGDIAISVAINQAKSVLQYQLLPNEPFPQLFRLLLAPQLTLLSLLIGEEHCQQFRVFQVEFGVSAEHASHLRELLKRELDSQLFDDLFHGQLADVSGLGGIRRLEQAPDVVLCDSCVVECAAQSSDELLLELPIR